MPPAIVGECLPYISQRLLADTSPRVGGALESFVFGAEASNPDRVLDAERLEMIIEGFGSYSSSTTGLTTKDGSPSENPSTASGSSSEAQVSALTDTLLDLILAPEPTPLQALVIDQVAKIAAAGGRAIFASARTATGGYIFEGRSLLGLALDPLGLFQGSALVELDSSDRRALEAATKVSPQYVTALELKCAGAVSS